MPTLLSLCLSLCVLEAPTARGAFQPARQESWPLADISLTRLPRSRHWLVVPLGQKEQWLKGTKEGDFAEGKALVLEVGCPLAGQELWMKTAPCWESCLGRLSLPV